MLKKILFVFFSLIFLAMLFYLYRYERGHCVCNMIPVDSEAVIIVNARNLEQHFLNDVLMNPLSYLSSDKPSVKDTVKNEVVETEKRVSLLDGITLPKIVVFSKRRGADIGWESSQIDVKNTSVITEYFGQNGYEYSTVGDERHFSKGDIFVQVLNGKLKLLYGFNPEVGASKKLVYRNAGDKIFDFITDTESDIAYIDDIGNHMTLDFDKGTMNVAGNYNFNFLNTLSEVVEGEGVAQISANFETSKLIGLMTENAKVKVSNFTKLSLDSIQDYWDGKLLASINGLIAMSDTIKTYEYDDDFNKIEVSKVESSTSIDYNAILGIEDAGVQYMFRKNAIVEDGGGQVVAIMPLVKTFSVSNEDGFNIYTNEVQLHTQEADLKFKAIIKPQALFFEEHGNYLSLPSAFNKIEEINLEIDKKNKITGKMSLQSKRNALVSFVFD